jgi:hypothetical protein
MAVITADLKGVTSLSNAMNPQTTVGIAKTGVRSLRGTIPESIVIYLELESGDKLEWKMDAMDGKRVAVVSKVAAP